MWALGFGIPRFILIYATGNRGSQSTGNSLPVADGRSNRKDDKMTTEGAKFAKLAVEQITIPGTDVSVYQALYQRRMAWQFKDAAVPKAAVERMLEAAGKAA